MKRLFILLISLVSCFYAYSNDSFFKDIEDEHIPSDKAESLFSEWFGVSSDISFLKFSEQQDKLGFTHSNYQQYFKGIPIDGNIVIVHSKNGYVSCVNGQAATIFDLSSVSVSRLKSTSLADSNVVVFKCQTDSGLVYKLAREKKEIIDNKPYLVVYDLETNKILSKIPLSYNLDVEGTVHTLYSGIQNITCNKGSGNIYVLQDSGRNISIYDGLGIDLNNCNTDTLQNRIYKNTSNVWGGYNYISKVTIKEISQNWWYNALTDTKPDLYIKIKDNNGNVIYTSNAIDDTYPPVSFNIPLKLLSSIGYSIEVYDKDALTDDYGETVTINTTEEGSYDWSFTNTQGTLVISSVGKPEYDAFWGMEKAYDYFKDTFGRISYDNKGGLLQGFISSPNVTSPQNCNNAAANPYVWGLNYICFGLGDFKLFNPLVSLDVTAHEFTHLVTSYNRDGDLNQQRGLNYQRESGALNESFSDIFGTCVEFAYKSNPNWLIGEDEILGCTNLRSMKNPKLGQDGVDPQPDTYKGDYWHFATDTTDYGGVHANSGVQNKWFYLLCEGGSGNNDLYHSYSVTGIGMKKAEQIAYRNLITYLTPNASYYDAYLGSLRSAKDLYGEGEEYKAVKDAWYAVGVDESIAPASVRNTMVTTPNNSFNAYSKNGSVYVEATVGKTIKLYAVSGELICSTSAKSSLTEIPVSFSPIVIVSVDGVSKKVMVR